MNGIIVAADLTQEWLLPWWWKHYLKHNAFPVAFVDLGMSFEMKDWCKARGELIPLRLVDFAAEKEEMDPTTVKAFEAEFGSFFWDSRNAWFKKPFACLASPFRKTVWIDLDCEIRGSLAPLFECLDTGPGVAMALAPDDSPLYAIYNSGVIVYDNKGFSLIQEWANRCFERSRLFCGDQEVFSHLIAEKGIDITVLSPLFNWSRFFEDNPCAVILHWHGPHGKHVIRHQISCS